MTTVEEVRPSLFRICEESDDKLLALYLLVGADRVLLIDAGLAETPGRTLVPALAQTGVSAHEIDYVLVTHADVDHSGGLGALQRLVPSIRTMCGSADRPLIEDVESMIDRRYREFRHHGIDQPEDFIAWVRGSADPCWIDLGVAAGEIRLSPEWTVEVLTAPGHSDGHVVVHDEHNDALIIGDAVLGHALPSIAGHAACAPTYRRVDDYLATISRLRKLNARLLLTAHFPVMSGGDVDDFWTISEDFCGALERVLLNALADGPCSTRSLLDAAADQVRTWPANMDDSLVYAVVGHLERLESRGVIRRRSESPLVWQVCS